jgi:hydroxymethylpyrimidine pyrophosphatase-like HAD family hydrolase
MSNSKIIAVDFDGTLVEDRFPEIGEPTRQTINALLAEQARGARVILWTCRRGAELEAAVEWCKAHRIKLDAVNANIPEMIAVFGEDTRKIYADEYWDDRARLMPPKSTDAVARD